MGGVGGGGGLGVVLMLVLVLLLFMLLMLLILLMLMLLMLLLLLLVIVVVVVVLEARCLYVARKPSADRRLWLNRSPFAAVISLRRPSTGKGCAVFAFTEASAVLLPVRQDRLPPF